MFQIEPLAQTNKVAIQTKIDSKTKPLGALGKLEQLAQQLALITNKDQITLTNPTMLVFAGDHGIAEEGVSIAPSAVTQQMVMNFLNGGAAINCFCRTHGLALDVIDAGILLPIDDARLTQQSLGNGTRNFSKHAAMNLGDVEKGIELGAQVARKHLDAGTNVIGFGEMGIGNTSCAAAILATLTGIDAAQCVGRGTGISDEALANKVRLVEQAIAMHQQDLTSAEQILACVGGFEVVQIVGAMLAAAERKSVILVDGFIITAAAMLAIKINPACKDYMVFCHQSQEQGHQIMLKELDVTALLDMGFRLGEGTGAALAYPMLQAAASFYNDMASFDSAGVDNV